MVTLQSFTRGKSFYLGKISLGKFTSGFIFARLKGHTGDHWTLGGLTSQRINFLARVFKMLAQKNCGAKIENMLENQMDQREVFILISLLLITLFQRARRAGVILMQRLISQRIQRRRRAAFNQFLTIFAWQQGRSIGRNFVPFQRVKHVMMWWKQSRRVSRETFNFICATVGQL